MRVLADVAGEVVGVRRVGRLALVTVRQTETAAEQYERIAPLLRRKLAVHDAKQKGKFFPAPNTPEAAECKAAAEARHYLQHGGRA